MRGQRGELSGLTNVLLATIEPGDQVLMTDSTYVGLINRVRLAGGVPRYVPLVPALTDGGSTSTRFAASTLTTSRRRCS